MGSKICRKGHASGKRELVIKFPSQRKVTKRRGLFMDRTWFHVHKRAIAATLIVLVCLFLTVLVPTLLEVPWDFWKKIGYPGIFLLSLIGASSIIIPIPYTVILLAIAPAFDPILLTISAGSGSAMGELAGYALGYLGRGVMGKGRRHQLNAMLKIFDRFGAFALFFFALTPLPDDLIIIPLGLIRYSFWKTIVACLAGKLAMIFIIANVGKVTGELFSVSWPLALLTAVLLFLIIVLMFKIDWVKLAEKYASKKGDKRAC